MHIEHVMALFGRGNVHAKARKKPALELSTSSGAVSGQIDELYQQTLHIAKLSLLKDGDAAASISLFVGQVFCSRWALGY